MDYFQPQNIVILYRDSTTGYAKSVTMSDIPNMQELCEASQAVNDASSGISAFTETLSKEAQNLAELAENTAKVAHELMEIMKAHV